MKGVVMKCNEVCELMPDLAAGLDAVMPEVSKHIESCSGCAEKLNEFRQTMALLDEWQVPEPSPYFDVRLQARLREEMAKPQAGWLHWFRRPVLAAALTVIMGVGVGIIVTRGRIISHETNSSLSSNFSAPERGSAVSDLQDLEQNQDLYSSFELLDDMDLQQDVVANP